MRSTAPRDNEITLGPERVDLPTYRGFRRSSVLDKCESGSPATLQTGIAKRAARMPKRPGTLRHESRHNGGARRGGGKSGDGQGASAVRRDSSRCGGEGRFDTRAPFGSGAAATVEPFP